MRRLALVLTLPVVLVMGATSAWVAAGMLTNPAPRPIGPPPADLHATDVRIPAADGGHVAGWHVPGKPGAGAVLLLHGIRSDRRQMLPRARFLAAAGYAVLLIDLPAHGESSGERITFGRHEAMGVSAALDELQRRSPGERIGIIGASLGGAAALLAHPEHKPDAMVLEAVFPTIEEAASNRLRPRIGALDGIVTPALLQLLPLRLGVTAAELRPIEAIAKTAVPILVASGNADTYTTWAETVRLFEAAKEPKQLWAVEGASHVDLHDYDPPAYRHKVLPFLEAHLKQAR